MRGIRGATQVESNTVEAIQDGVAELCRAIVEANRIQPEEIVWAIFTVTHDLDADFPVPGSLSRTIRVLIHVDSGSPRDVKHVYLRGARVLRPDLHR